MTHASLAMNLCLSAICLLERRGEAIAAVPTPCSRSGRDTRCSPAESGQNKPHSPWGACACTWESTQNTHGSATEVEPGYSTLRYILICLSASPPGRALWFGNRIIAYGRVEVKSTERKFDFFILAGKAGWHTPFLCFFCETPINTPPRP